MNNASDLRIRKGPWWRLRLRIHQKHIHSLRLDEASAIVLKTDLFDEASGPYHFAAKLPNSVRFVGMDVNLEVVRLARQRLQESLEKPLCLAADVRHLPFAQSSMNAVLSISTLDHFRDESSIEVALQELYRILAKDGKIFLTLDNPYNLEVFLRQKLPASLVQRLRADRFPLGVTLNADTAHKLLTEIGFKVDVETFLVHVWRYPTIRLLNLLGRLLPARIVEGFIQFLEWLELLDKLPTRSLTGHYSAWIAHK